MKSLLAVGILSCLVAFGSSAHATPFTPQIDFRDESPWKDANHEASFSFSLSGSLSGLSITLDANPNPATLWWDDKDGLGIRHSYEKDEIEFDELLKVSFEMPVQLSAIYISDLFEERGYFEKGSYRINGQGLWFDFDAGSLPGSNANGERLIDVVTPADGVSLVEFMAPGKIGNQNHEFALMGFDATLFIQTPEPGTGMLLGLGLLLLGARRLR